MVREIWVSVPLFSDLFLTCWRGYHVALVSGGLWLASARFSVTVTGLVSYMSWPTGIRTLRPSSLALDNCSCLVLWPSASCRASESGESPLIIRLVPVVSNPYCQPDIYICRPKRRGQTMPLNQSCACQPFKRSFSKRAHWYRVLMLLECLQRKQALVINNPIKRTGRTIIPRGESRSCVRTRVD